jgi:hypothetical protein
MTIEKAFKHLLDSWGDQDTEFVTKYRTYKSRFLNLSGNQKKKVSKWKMVEMLEAAGYIEIKFTKKAPK